MKKRILSLILAVGMMTTLAACGGSTGSSTGDSTGGDTTEAKGIPLKVATYYADTHPTSIALEEVFKPMIDEGTEGRYTVELYSNNGLGSETEFNEGVSLGTIECCVTGNLMADQVIPLCMLPTSPGCSTAWKRLPQSATIPRSSRSSRML